MERYENRTVTSKFELRNLEDSDKPTIISGTASVFNSLSEPLFKARVGKKMVEVREQIDPKAFDAVMKTDPDVVGLFNHDMNIVLGRTTNKTLELRVTADGLVFDILPPDTQLVRDMVLAPMKRGDVTQSSFGFSLDPDNGDDFEEKDGLIIRTIKKVAELRDVSPVTLPAYLDTDSIVRSLKATFEDFSDQLEHSLEMNSEERKEFSELKEKYKRLVDAHETLKRITAL